MVNARGNRHDVRPAQKNRITALRTISQKIYIFAVPSVSARTVRLQCVAVWPVSSATISLTSLDNAPYRKRATLVSRTTKLDTGVSKCRLLDEPWFSVHYSDYQLQSPKRSQVAIFGNYNTDRCISETLRLAVATYLRFYHILAPI